MDDAHVPYEEYQTYPPETMQARAKAFYDEMRRRRSVRGTRWLSCSSTRTIPRGRRRWGASCSRLPSKTQTKRTTRSVGET